MNRLIAAAEALLKHFEHVREPTQSAIAHLPAPEILELRAAHAEATPTVEAEKPAELEAPLA